MPDRQSPGRSDYLARLQPPTVTYAEKPMRRAVAMAYRTVREAGRSHRDALDAAKAVCFQARPEGSADRLATSARINEMIASAIQINPQWFWKNVRALIEHGDHLSRRDARSPNP